MPGTLVDVQGGLLPPALLDRIAAGDVEGQDISAFGLDGNRRLIDEVQRAFSDARAEWDAFQVRRNRSSDSPTTLTRQCWAEPFFEILGFQSLRTQRRYVEIDHRGIFEGNHHSEFALAHRLLFLMVAQERHLIFPEDGGVDDRAAVYRRYFSVAALRGPRGRSLQQRGAVASDVRSLDVA